MTYNPQMAEVGPSVSLFPRETWDDQYVLQDMSTVLGEHFPCTDPSVIKVTLYAVIAQLPRPLNRGDLFTGCIGSLKMQSSGERSTNPRAAAAPNPSVQGACASVPEPKPSAPTTLLLCGPNLKYRRWFLSRWRQVRQLLHRPQSAPETP